MNIKDIIVAAGLAGCFLISCKSKEQNNDAAKAGQQPGAATTTSLPSGDPAAVNPFAGLSGTNPEHGQPGHRCDIAVGAPLNTPPQEGSAVQPAISSPVPQQPFNQQAPQDAVGSGQTAPGFSGKPNPEHGQPGHRCDLEVGAILP